ncbi:MAG: flagellar biosynthetic protein FliR [Myxococcales bacterium]|nr:flagellar biosynthetic protein FliR [Myxococcales bacterium]
MNEVVIATFLAAFARSAAFLFSAPIIGGPIVPSKVRVGASASIALAIATVRAPVDPIELPLLIPGEILMGLAAGFAIRLVFAGAESGGQLIGLHLGLGMASFFDPSVGEQAIVTRRFALVFAGLAFLMMGGLREAVRVLALAPADISTLSGAVVQLMEQTNQVLISALRFAAPAMLAGMVTNVGMAFASKAAPSLNIFSVMLSALLITGGFTLIVTAPAFISEINGTARRAIDAMQIVGGMR